MRAAWRFIGLPALAVVVSSGCAQGNDVDGFGGQGNATSQGGAASGGGSAGGGAASGGGGQAPNGGAPGVGGAGGDATSTSTGQSLPGTLIFSEYVEGTGNNKAVEIANIGDTPVALGDCVINRYQNGASAASTPALVVDSVTLGSASVHVVCNSGFAQAGLCDQTSAELQHSGNDVVELVCGGDVKDIIGRIGEDAVWGVSPTITQDATLRRSCSVTQGDDNGSDAFDPSGQWSGFAVDTFADLGQYACP